MRRFPSQQERAPIAGEGVRGADGRCDPGVRVMPPRPRVTRLELLQLHRQDRSGAFAGRTHQVVCDAMEAEGVEAEERYEPMYQLRAVPAGAVPAAGVRRVRRPARSVADVVPRRRGCGLRESVYFDGTCSAYGGAGSATVQTRSAKIQDTPGARRRDSSAHPSGRSAAGADDSTSSSESSRGPAGS